ncbi:MAG: histidine kinase [Kibdelosporangium sp.]
MRDLLVKRSADVGVVLMVLVLFGASGVLDSWTAVALSAAQIVPLLARRLMPGTVLTVATVTTVLHVLLGLHANIGYIPALVGLFSAPSSPRRFVRSWLCVGAAVAIGSAMGSVKGPVSGTLLTMAVAAVAWTLGVERQRQLAGRMWHAVEQQAADRRERTAMRLHDTLGQTTTVMLVQAEALRTVGRLTDADRRRVDAILAAGRQALTEVRRTLRDLREDGSPEDPDFDLAALLDRLRAAGLKLDGDPVPALCALPGPARTLAERVIGEAATNVLRHAGPDAHASIVVRVTNGKVRIRVRNTVPDGSAAEAGFGLSSLRRQVVERGGSLQFGRSGRLWLVRAHFPWYANSSDTVTKR